MDNNSNQKELLEIVERSLDDFRQSMEYREKLSIRIGRRTTQIIRFGLFGLSMLGLALFYLIFVLTKDFSKITTQMTAMAASVHNMEQNFATVAGTITRVHETLVVLNDNITVIPALNSSVRSMDHSMGVLSTDMHAMVKQIEYMNGNVSSMTDSMHILNNQFSDMNRAVGNMAANMHKITRPMGVLPF